MARASEFVNLLEAAAIPQDGSTLAGRDKAEALFEIAKLEAETWARFAAARIAGGYMVHDAIASADTLLTEFRKRFCPTE